MVTQNTSSSLQLLLELRKGESELLMIHAAVHLNIYVIKLGWKGGCGSEAEALCLKDQLFCPSPPPQFWSSECPAEAGLLTILY